MGELGVCVSAGQVCHGSAGQVCHGTLLFSKAEGVLWSQEKGLMRSTCAHNCVCPGPLSDVLTVSQVIDETHQAYVRLKSGKRANSEELSLI